MESAVEGSLRINELQLEERRGSFRRSSAAHAIEFTSRSRTNFEKIEAVVDETKKKAVHQGLKGKIVISYSICPEKVIGPGMHIWAHCSLPSHTMQTTRTGSGGNRELVVKHQVVHPARTIPLLRSGIDKAVLPKDNVAIWEHVQFCSRLLDLKDDQFLWTSGKNLVVDDDIQSELVDYFVDYIEGFPPNASFCIVPYSGLFEGSQKWMHEVCGRCTEHSVRIMGDHEQSLAEFCQRGILHPPIDFPWRFSISKFLSDNCIGNVIEGWYCQTVEEVERAFMQLGASFLEDQKAQASPLAETKESLAGSHRAALVMKPALGFGHPPATISLFTDSSSSSNGGSECNPQCAADHMQRIWDRSRGQELATNFLEYGPVLLQRFRSARLVRRTHVVHSMKTTLVQDILDHEHAESGGDSVAWLPCRKSLSFIRKCYCIATSLLFLLAPVGPGEFEFISSKGCGEDGEYECCAEDEEPILVDIRLGRFSAAHLVKLFSAQIAPGRPFCAWLLPPLDLSSDDIWELLKEHKLQLHPVDRLSNVRTLAGPQHLRPSRASGIFPYCNLRNEYCLLFAVGNSFADVEAIRRKGTLLLEQKQFELSLKGNPCRLVRDEGTSMSAPHARFRQ
eukprot:ANDGO_04873.mRNA.1 isoaspartyl dipeptidase